MDRKRRLLIMASLAVCSLCPPLAAQTAESIPNLFIPVGTSDFTRLQAKSSYGLRQQTYFAKRYQIVKIDFSLLDRPGATFDLAALPGVSIRMTARDIEGTPSGAGLREWTGEVVSPAIDKSSGIESPEVLHPTVNLWISSESQVPVRVARQIAQQEKSAQSLGALPEEDLPSSAASVKLKLRTLSGQWFVPALGAQFVIQPVDDDPRFHVIYEADFDKMPQGTHGGNPVNEEKLRRAAQFSEALQSEKRAAEAAARDR